MQIFIVEQDIQFHANTTYRYLTNGQIFGQFDHYVYIQQFGHWSRVILQNGEIGYIHRSYIRQKCSKLE